MSGKTAVITLDGKDYTVHKFNMGELREVTRILRDGGGGGVRQEATFDIVAVALRRAEPKVEDSSSIETTLPELHAALITIMDLAGLERERAPNPPTAAAG